MSIESIPLSRESFTYHDIAELDPLSLDEIMILLPELNRRQDVESINTVLSEVVCTSQYNVVSQEDALAALRDLDFLASSLLRHGAQPLQSVDGLEGELMRLGNVAGTIPRGTVFTYASINPLDERMRSFTGTTEEALFIDSVRNGTLALDLALTSLSDKSMYDDEGMAEALTTSAAAMDTMIASIINVYHTITPEFFSEQMRPYFEPLVIGGRKFTGAGGAQMQLLAIDRVLWGNNETDPEYQGFFNENYEYLTPTQKESLGHFLTRNSQTTLVEWLESHPDEYPQMRQETVSLLRKIKKFRYPHRRVAKGNFNIRKKGAVGSGSYTPDILDVLISKTEESILRATGEGDA
ncbi:MAG: PrnB [Candidatus Saccharibacteria bacterium GW2011_GWC2_48_9]|nr:MAG: PrnB [Candidatus Saccharibacteria bacterium GW2011_GWC2_48_9]HCH34925.1 hypothetical protein [Candidatus Saccharibacteria bacterium]